MTRKATCFSARLIWFLTYQIVLESKAELPAEHSKEQRPTMLLHSKYFSDEARKSSEIFQVAQELELFATPSPTHIQLGDGQPDPATYPYLEATFALRSGEDLHLPQHLLTEILQYSPHGGLPQLVSQLREMTERLHAPPHMAERGMVVTSGAIHGMYLVLRMFLNPGDIVLMEEPSFSGVINMVKSQSLQVVGVHGDDEGIIPSRLKAALTTCKPARTKLLYLVPNGSNPTGTTMGETRRREIYSLACEHDFLILEDDPYYLMQFIKEPPPSFLSLDTEGRVLRADTFSKILCPGIRLGYITADKPFADLIRTGVAGTVQQASALPQVLLSETLRCWGHEGFLQRMRSTAEVYQHRRDVMLQAATTHLSGLCEWTVPAASMFLWLKVLGLKDVGHLVRERCVAKDVIVLPGNLFMMDTTKPCPYLRLCYATASPDTVDKALRVLAESIREELKQ